MGSAQAVVILYAIGGGAILGTHTLTIAPKAKAAGVHSAWFSSLNLSQVESIIAVTDSSSLCGIAIGGDIAQSRLLFTPATPVSNFSSQGGASDSLIGNYTFVYTIISTYTDKITLDTKSDDKTSDNTYFYEGYDADYSSVTLAMGAWYPSISKYIIISGLLSSSPYSSSYVFSINADNTLSGDYKLSSDYGATWSNPYSFIIPNSRKTPLGSWDALMTSIKSQNDPVDITEIFQKKMAEDQESQVQRAKFMTPVRDDLLTSKINELKAVLEKHRLTGVVD